MRRHPEERPRRTLSFETLRTGDTMPTKIIDRLADRLKLPECGHSLSASWL
jgi:hypothetical protein